MPPLPKPNALMRAAKFADMLPAGLRMHAITKMFGFVVPLVGTSGVRFESLQHNEVIVSIKNRRKVQNHIKGVHAASMALLAETATGIVTGLNVPDERIVLIKTLKVDYHKIAKGDMRAVASLTDEQTKFIQETEKGELQIPVTITDESGGSPCQATMLWAWVPKKSKNMK